MRMYVSDVNDMHWRTPEVDITEDEQAELERLITEAFGHENGYFQADVDFNGETQKVIWNLRHVTSVRLGQ